MTFSQLSLVRADGLVEEGTVFRALWQREALERLIFPTVDLKADKSHADGNTASISDRHDALSDYFDIGANSGLNQMAIAKKKRLLLGTPKFRFGTSIQLTSMRKNEWKEEMIFLGQTLAQLVVQTSNDHPSKYVKALRNTFYSAPKTILGTRYRVRVEAFVLSFENMPKLLVCNFELQRRAGEHDTKEMKDSKVRYSIYCLNRHLVADVDSNVLASVEREQRAFMPVSKCEMSEASEDKWLATEIGSEKSYTTNVVLTDGMVETPNIDVMVVMELFDLNLA
ncbi:hypothetical protein BGW37DRAFT_434734 [Umbelopsis sp. PMI_123]|nr:hypothetical protein BGW37DRAFT_434734 [Umbelopsis sp. PMI_123]